MVPRIRIPSGPERTGLSRRSHSSRPSAEKTRPPGAGEQGRVDEVGPQVVASRGDRPGHAFGLPERRAEHQCADEPGTSRRRDHPQQQGPPDEELQLRRQRVQVARADERSRGMGIGPQHPDRSPQAEVGRVREPQAGDEQVGPHRQVQTDHLAAEKGPDVDRPRARDLPKERQRDEVAAQDHERGHAAPQEEVDGGHPRRRPGGQLRVIQHHAEDGDPAISVERRNPGRRRSGQAQGRNERGRGQGDGVSSMGRADILSSRARCSLDRGRSSDRAGVWRRAGPRLYAPAR